MKTRSLEDCQVSPAGETVFKDTSTLSLLSQSALGASAFSAAVHDLQRDKRSNPAPIDTTCHCLCEPIISVRRSW